MKNLFLIILLLLAGGAGFIAFQTNSKLKSEEAALAAAEALRTTRTTELTAQKKETETKKADQKTAESALATTRTEITNAKTDITTANRSISDLTGDLEEVEAAIKSEKESLEAARDLLTKLFPGESDVNFDNFEEKFNQLEEKVKALTESNAELEILVDEAAKDLASSKSELERQIGKNLKYKQSLSQNSVTGLITAVNPDWGFAVVNLGLNDGMDPENELLVVRGGQRIGRLALSTIESNQSIANIDYDSISSGAMIRPGDKVMLAKPNRGN